MNEDLYVIDFCACGGRNRMKCGGQCRESHTDNETGIVKCFERYRVDRPKSNRRSNRRNDDSDPGFDRDLFRQRRRQKFSQQDNSSVE